MERRKVLQVDIVHGVQDVPADFAVLPIKLLEKFTNFLTFTRVLGGTGIDCDRKGSFLMKVTDGSRIQ